MPTSEKKKILIVDDDVKLLRELKSHLEKIGYAVLTAADARTALELVKTTELDLVVLDINFPDTSATRGRSIDGLEVLRVIREAGDIPVLMLSATNISAVKVMTLTMGADDYVSKPFEMDEFAARVGVILRRCIHSMSGEQILSLNRLRLDPGERRAWKDGNAVELTGIEFDILYTLARRPEHVFTREKLIDSAWRSANYCVLKAVDVHIGHIRKKIEDNPSRPAFIVTVRGTGYRFEDASL